MDMKTISIIALWIGCLGMAICARDGFVTIVIALCALGTTKLILGV